MAGNGPMRVPPRGGEAPHSASSTISASFDEASLFGPSPVQSLQPGLASPVQLGGYSSFSVIPCTSCLSLAFDKLWYPTVWDNVSKARPVGTLLVKVGNAGHCFRDPRHVHS